MKRILVAVALLTSLSCAQVATGPLPFGSFGGGPFDSVNLGNLNVNFTIPITQKAGRGVPFFYGLSYNNSLWFPTTSNGVTTWTPVSNWGWKTQTDAAYGYIVMKVLSLRCRVFNPDTGLWFWSYYSYNVFSGYNDRVGGLHAMGGSTTAGSTDCGVDPVDSFNQRRHGWLRIHAEGDRLHAGHGNDCFRRRAYTAGQPA